jgi:hypothetical protein
MLSTCTRGSNAQGIIEGAIHEELGENYKDEFEEPGLAPLLEWVDAVPLEWLRLQIPDTVHTKESQMYLRTSFLQVFFRFSILECCLVFSIHVNFSSSSVFFFWFGDK